MTLIALKQQSTFQLTVLGMATGRADKTTRPTPLKKSLETLLFSTILFKKIRQTETPLKLDSVSANGSVPPIKVWSRLPLPG